MINQAISLEIFLIFQIYLTFKINKNNTINT